MIMIRSGLRSAGVAWMVWLSAAAAADAWWNGDWAYRQRVIIDGTLVDEDLVDFPLRIAPGDAAFARAWAAEDGRDLRVVDGQGTPLEFEIVAWEPDRVELYVRCPRIRAGDDDQYLYLYFGNPQAEAPPPGRVWDSHYVSVLHLEGDRRDSTGRTSAVEQTGVVFQNGWTPGLMGSEIHPWLTFDDGFDRGYLQFTSDVMPLRSGGFTVTCRYRTRRPGRQCLFAATSPSAEDGFSVLIDSVRGAGLQVRSNNGAQPEFRLPGVEVDRWQTVTAAVDGAAGVGRLSMDGNLAENPMPAPGEIADLRFGRGSSPADNFQFHGDLDEVRVSNVARSAAWLRAESANLTEANPLVRLGPVETVNGTTPPPPPPALVTPLDGSASYRPQGATLTWLPAAGAESYVVEIYEDPDGTRLAVSHDADAATSFDLTLPGEQTVYWTVAARSQSGQTRASELRRLDFRRWPPDATRAGDNVPRIETALRTSPDATIAPAGYLGERLRRMADYMARFPEINPGMLQMLRDRNRPVVSWAGVFPGQYLSSGVLIERATGHAELKDALDAYVRELVACQAPDGGLNIGESFKGSLSLWNHYAALYGLLLYHEDSQDPAVLEACRRIADRALEAYGPEGEPPPAVGGANESFSHALVLLYDRTGDIRYLEGARYLVDQVSNETGGTRYRRMGLERRPATEFPVRRWESVHNLSTLCELYRVTGDDAFREAVLNLYEVLRDGERHNTGAFSTDEGFLGTPHIQGTLETCCTVAWIAVSIDVLKMTGDPRVADEIEWSTLNAALGAIPYSGATSSYSNPPDGLRNYGNEIRGQATNAGPELNCCSTNACRGPGMIALWALMAGRNGELHLNFYGPGTFALQLPSGNRLVLEQETAYPADNRVALHINLSQPERFPLALRIPGWSTQTSVRVNGAAVEREIRPGIYLVLDRTWTPGDVVELDFDFTLRTLPGEGPFQGKASVYRGPLLLAYDVRFGNSSPDALPPLDTRTLIFEPTSWTGSIPPWLLGTLRDATGAQYPVCDYSSAGQTGTPYRSWLPVGQAPP